MMRSLHCRLSARGLAGLPDVAGVHYRGQGARTRVLRPPPQVTPKRARICRELLHEHVVSFKFSSLTTCTVRCRMCTTGRTPLYCKDMTPPV